MTSNVATFARKTCTLLKFRLFIYSLAFAHLVIMTIRLLGKDFDQSDDVNIRLYSKFKWKLITTWFNLLSYVYIPLSMYCDWRELNGNSLNQVILFNKARDFMFTNLLLPTTAFADILFWRLFYHDKNLVFPPAVEKVIYLWEHHSMHTVSLIFVIFDLVFVRRERPKNIMPGIIAMLAFLTIYTVVCVRSIINEEYLYPVFQKLSPYNLFVLSLYTYISFLFYHAGQWLIVDFIHGQRGKSNKNV